MAENLKPFESSRYSFSDYVKDVMEELRAKHGWRAPYNMLENNLDIFDCLYQGFGTQHNPVLAASDINEFFG